MGHRRAWLQLWLQFETVVRSLRRILQKLPGASNHISAGLGLMLAEETPDVCL